MPNSYGNFYKNIFWCDLPRLAVFIIFVLFLPSSGLIHLVFRQTRESNPHPRTMAQTVSPRCSPLDLGASPIVKEIATETTAEKKETKCLQLGSKIDCICAGYLSTFVNESISQLAGVAAARKGSLQST